MSATFQNSAKVLSIGIFFTLMILGLAAALPAALDHGLVAQGVPPADARAGRAPAAGRRSVRRLPRLQPGRSTLLGPAALASCPPATRPT